jgi:hypothetical protein
MCKLEGFYDEVAIRNSYDAGTIVKGLTMEKVNLFLKSLGVETVEVYDDHLVCPTICHNPIDEAETMKLYYYDKTKNFHCYTECSENFNIITLYQKYLALNHQEVSYDEALYYIRQFMDVKENEFQKTEKISWETSIETQKQSIITLPEVDKNALDYFIPFSHPLWEMEEINSEIQDRFNIRFSLLNNRIIIPHFDINGRLIGIRMRAIEEEDLTYGKYRPVQIGERMFNHQLGFNLYGIWEHKEAIRKTKRVVIYEGEKSVLKDSAYYGPYSVAVATCGSQLNRFQINLLVQELGVNEIILAYDKEYDETFSEEGIEYRQKLISKCEKYRGMANFYYLFDEHNVLNKKDAPCDQGLEKLEFLMKRRIKIK